MRPRILGVPESKSFFFTGVPEGVFEIDSNFPISFLIGLFLADPNSAFFSAFTTGFIGLIKTASFV